MNNQIQTVRMGEIGIGSAGQTLSTLLGSCVGVIVFDPKRGVAGLAHIQLPVSSPGVSQTQDSLGKYADIAIPELLRQVRSGGDPEPFSNRLVTHIAGGADMFATSRTETVGKLNIVATQKILTELQLRVSRSDCGGTRARRVRFDIASGDLEIQTINASEPEIRKTLTQPEARE